MRRADLALLDGMHVLRVEDDEDFRAAAAATMHLAGAIVTEARTADEAAPLLQRHQTGLLVSDFQLPGRLTGIELINLAHTEEPDLPVVALSGVGSFSELIGHESVVVLRKPIGAERLLREMLRAVDVTKP